MINAIVGDQFWIYKIDHAQVKLTHLNFINHIDSTSLIFLENASHASLITKQLQLIFRELVQKIFVIQVSRL